ncbi:hypothetical protein GCM10023068_44160 [Leifsonia shinshuensis]
MDVDRRHFLTLAGGLTAGALAAGTAFAAQAATPGTAAASAPPLPAPAASGIDHIVVVMMENRSFDHLVGWMPGATGLPSGLRYIDRYGFPHTPITSPTSRAAAIPTPTIPSRAAASS